MCFGLIQTLRVRVALSSIILYVFLTFSNWWLLVLLPVLLPVEPAQDQRKTENRAKQATKDQHQIYVVRQCAYIYEKWQLIIITLIMNKLQVQYKQQLAWSLSVSLFKTSLNLLALLFCWTLSLFFSSAKIPIMNNMIKYIYTLVASSRNKDYTLVSRPIQLWQHH